MDFNVPVAGHGDSYDRYLVRLQEMRESVRIIYQCLNEMPNGPYKTPDNKIAPPRCVHCLCTFDLIHSRHVCWCPYSCAGMQSKVRTERIIK